MKDKILSTQTNEWRDAMNMLNILDEKELGSMSEAEMLLHTLLHTSPYGVILINQEGIIVMATPAITELTGYAHDSLQGQSIFELLPQGESRQALEHHFQQILTDLPQPIPYFCLIPCQDKTRINVRIDWNYIQTKEGDSQGLLCIVRDVSEEQHGAKQSPTIIEQVQYSRLATVEEVVSRIAHELGQPLTAVINYTDGSLNKLKEHYPDSDLVQGMQMAVRQAHRASEVIERLKNFLRKGELKKEAININDVLHDVVCCMRPEMAAANVCVEYQVDPLIPILQIDRVQLEQVFLNLLQNALEALQTIKSDLRKIIISTSKPDLDSVKITIEDNGPGIAEETAHTIFDAFFTTKTTGMGIGLSISQSIVAAHAGKISVSSVIGQSTTFTVLLPVRAKRRII